MDFIRLGCGGLRITSLPTTASTITDIYITTATTTFTRLSYLTEWAANRYAAYAAWTALVAADLGLETDEYRRYGVSQIDYILGDCCKGADGE